MNKKIDVVYTWVDPNHLEWQNKKNKVSGKKTFANNTARYNSNLNELKYSLRSLDRYFSSHINKIYLVTNHGAIPEFIDATRQDIVIIDDRTLLGGNSYCSCVFESVLHKIPDLSENFLYLNDDMLLSKTLHLTDLIDKSGYPIWYQDTDQVVRFFTRFPFLTRFFDVDGYVTLARQDTYKKLNLGKKIPAPIGHCPRLFNKTAIEDFISQYPEDIAKLRKTLFRAKDTFCFVDAYCYYFHYHNKLKFKKNKKTLLFIQNDHFSSLINKVRLAFSGTFSFLCIADLRDKKKGACSWVKAYLEDNYHKRSKWEKA